MIAALADRAYFAVAFLLMGVGAYMLIGDRNLVKKVIGMNVFQTGIFLFFIASAYVTGASAPLLTEPEPYVSPLPHVLILTAIVVGVSLTAVALGLIVRIYGEYGTLRADLIEEVSDGE
ncbi:cation:proton antiporter subunit C [Halobaculum sp. CBA1158]|uniref:cation:proton antiporter subunit C n=1 Tax=Halobaculum sp. CBA1158 TaxID=2904243 RepID=UPI001EEBED1A|nr:cation:proton antiporter subunit C [Halobaculum sp. CBA1158]UIO98466.1 cation:proton antiporter subunit C [Halobaculum sp. CBA1158]